MAASKDPAPIPELPPLSVGSDLLCAVYKRQKWVKLALTPRGSVDVLNAFTPRHVEAKKLAEALLAAVAYSESAFETTFISLVEGVCAGGPPEKSQVLDP
jgi:hypothetical protein